MANRNRNRNRNRRGKAGNAANPINAAKLSASPNSAYLKAVVNAVTPLAPKGAVIRVGYKANSVYVSAANGINANLAFSVLSALPFRALVSFKARANAVKPGRLTITLPPNPKAYYGASVTVNPITGKAVNARASAPSYKGALKGKA